MLKDKLFHLLIITSLFLIACNSERTEQNKEINNNSTNSEIANNSNDTPDYVATSFRVQGSTAKVLYNERCPPGSFKDRKLDRVARRDITKQPPPSVLVFEHPNFEGKCMEIFKGDYLGSKGDLNQVGNDAISSIKVPFGKSIDSFENEGEGGMKLTYEPGEYPTIGGDNTISKITAYDFSTVYLTSASLPSSTVKWSGEISNKEQSVRGELKAGEVAKSYEYNIPPGCNLGVWESTKTEFGRWSHTIKDQKLYITLIVREYNRMDAIGHTWVGVRFNCNP